MKNQERILFCRFLNHDQFLVVLNSDVPTKHSCPYNSSDHVLNTMSYKHRIEFYVIHTTLDPSIICTPYIPTNIIRI